MLLAIVRQSHTGVEPRVESCPRARRRQKTRLDLESEDGRAVVDLGYQPPGTAFGDHERGSVDALDLPNLAGAVEPLFPAHEALLRPGVQVPIVENLVNLGRLSRRPFRFVALPLKVRGATGSPIRAAARS